MKQETKELFLELLEKTSAGFLATIDHDGTPDIRAVFNLRNPEIYPKPAKAIKKFDKNPYVFYISTNTSSIKVRQIRENENVSIYLSIPEEFKGIMIKGKAEEIVNKKFKRDVWMEDWTQFYPKGHTDPDFTMLKVDPKSIRGWYKSPHRYQFPK